jgi:hypothetical protein
MKLTNLTGAEIKALRIKSGLTPIECALICGVTLRNWYHFEQGKPMREIYVNTMGWNNE